MSNVLAEICAEKRRWIAASKNRCSENQLLQQVGFSGAPRNFGDALKDKVSVTGVALVTELKKASPSKGLIRKNFTPAQLAVDYEKGGSACLSVLTDKPYFQGCDEYLVEARSAVEIPVLRKDFIIDPYQVIESRALGADCILLIMAALEDHQCQELTTCAEELKLDILIEVHDAVELSRALKIKGNFLIGINNRDLKTLKVDLNNTERLAPTVPKNYEIICESGISSFEDIQRVRDVGVYRFLVGESLMLQENLTEATEVLLGKKKNSNVFRKPQDG